jgi:hypothetical protein
VAYLIFAGEAGRALLERQVDLSPAFVLAQVLAPGCDGERLQELARLGDVVVEVSA